MATSGKIQDAASAALTAMEEALDLGAMPDAAGAADEANDRSGPGQSQKADAHAGDHRKSALGEQPNRAQQQHGAIAPAFAPANDDRRTVGELRQALQIKPSGSIMAVTFASMALWTACWALYAFFHQGEILDADASMLAPKPVLTFAALIAPLVFLFLTGLMARRAHEMRLIANSMTEVAIRLIEPETVATEQVVSLSQAIRREAASMGDGIERALARAGELEVIVRTEVTNLERSYTENERRIRLLIDELTREREAIVVNADNARTALFGAREALSQELATTSVHLAEAVSQAGARVASSLGSKGEEIRGVLEEAGDAFESTLASHGERVLIALNQTGDEVAKKVSGASDDVSRRFADGIEEVGRKLETAGDAIASDFGARSAEMLERFEELGAGLSDAVGGQGERIVAQLAETGCAIRETIETQGGAFERSVAETQERLQARVTEHVENAKSTFETAETRIVSLLEDTHHKAQNEFEVRGQTLHDAISRSLSQSSAQLVDQVDALQERFVSLASEAVSAIGQHGDRVNETLAENFHAFEQTVLGQGGDIAQRIAERGLQIETTLAERLAAFEDAVVRNSSEAAMRVAEHGDHVSSVMLDGLAAFEETFARQGTDVASQVAEHSERAASTGTAQRAAGESASAQRSQALAQRSQEIAPRGDGSGERG
ncbi:MAG: apolipoprotein acyltransferase, partial [Methylocystis sp.]